ncbi:MAG: hypothetical protein ACKOTD_00275 [Phycisphaerales bacterium]
MLLVTLAAGAAVWRTHAEAQAAATSRAAASDRILLDVGGRERQAIIVNPPPAEARRPAVIVLHGGMGSAEDMRARSGFDDVARANGFMVAYGQGTEFRDGARAWNTGSLLRRQVRDADDIAYLDALIDRLIADRGADHRKLLGREEPARHIADDEEVVPAELLLGARQARDRHVAFLREVAVGRQQHDRAVDILLAQQQVLEVAVLPAGPAVDVEHTQRSIHEVHSHGAREWSGGTSRRRVATHARRVEHRGSPSSVRWQARRRHRARDRRPQSGCARRRDASASQGERRARVRDRARRPDRHG